MSMKRNSLALFLALLIATGLQPLGAEPAAGKVSLLVANLAIPESLGKIDERFQGTSSRWVIDIQDVHAHFGAQENIAAILDHLNELYGLRLVAFEGGWSTTSYPKTWALPSSREKQLLLRTLLEEDLITGAAFAAMTSKMPITLHGMEEANLYKKNLRVYLAFLKKKDAVEKQVTVFQNKLSREKAEVFNPELQQFDRELVKFRENPKSIDKFFPLLLNQADTLKLAIASLPQIDLFRKMTALEKSIDKEKLKSEAQRLTQENKQNRLSLEELLRHGKLTGEKLAFYPNAKKQMDLIKLQDQLAHDQLFQEMEKLVGMIKERLFQKDEERALDARFTRFLTAKKLISLKATPDDLKQYLAEKTTIQGELDDPLLAQALRWGSRFYHLAQKRDQIFFNKITSDPALTQEDVALVAGGFHTEGLRQKLKKAGISYLVITPNIGEESPNEALYIKRLENMRVKTQTLSETGPRLTPEQDEIIAGAIPKLVSGELRDVRDVVDLVLNGMAVELKTAGTKKDFMALPAEQQRKAVEQAVEAVLTGQATLAIKGEDISRLLKSSPLARSVFRAILANQKNKVAVLAKSVLDLPDLVSDALGSNVITLPAKNWAGALRHRILIAAQESKRLVMIASDYKGSLKPGNVLLPVDVLSLILFAQGGSGFNLDNPASRDAFIKLAQEILTSKGFGESA